MERLASEKEFLQFESAAEFLDLAYEACEMFCLAVGVERFAVGPCLEDHEVGFDGL